MCKKILMAVLLLATVLYVTACGGDTSTTATTMHLKQTEGTVTVSDNAEKEVPLLENLNLYSGYGVDTRSESYAWISLDDVKLTKMDQESEITIQKEGKGLEIEIISGSLFFNVTQPLEDDETMDIRTSTMVVGIRGTCGWMEDRDGISRVYILEGTVECSAGGKTIQVKAGEMAELTAEGELVVQPFTVRDIPVFVQNDLSQDTDLCSTIYEASGLDVQSVVETEGFGKDSQTAGDAEEKASISYIFSHMPVAAYEVTGLGVGRSESVHDEVIFVKATEYNDAYSINPPLVRLTPGENTFILFCIPGDSDEVVTGDWDSPSAYISLATIHSPSESGQWEAITYTCLDGYIPTVEGFSLLTKQYKNSEYRTNAYNEGTYDAHFDSLLDVWLPVWLRFVEIYHPDAQQDDTIYVIEVMTYPGDEQSNEYDEMNEVLEKLKVELSSLGATSVKEISVEEALERCNVVVSEGDAD